MSNCPTLPAPRRSKPLSITSALCRAAVCRGASQTCTRAATTHGCRGKHEPNWRGEHRQSAAWGGRGVIKGTFGRALAVSNACPKQATARTSMDEHTGVLDKKDATRCDTMPGWTTVNSPQACAIWVQAIPAADASHHGHELAQREPGLGRTPVAIAADHSKARYTNHFGRLVAVISRPPQVAQRAGCVFRKYRKQSGAHVSVRRSCDRSDQQYIPRRAAS